MDQHLTLVEPTHLILTATGPEHLHQLKTVDIAANEELKAFDYALKHGLPFAINLSDEYVSGWYQRNQQALTATLIRTYSLRPINPTSVLADYIGKYAPEKGILQVSHQGKVTSFHLPLPGEHHAHNLLAALTLSSFFNLSLGQLQQGLAQFKTAYGRTEVYKLKNNIEVIGDYYNSNPTSVKAALQLLTEKECKGQTHAVLADMLELGDDEETFHRELAPLIISHSISKVWLYGERMKWLFDALKKLNYTAIQHFANYDELIQALNQNIHTNDFVLVKGSRGMKMEIVLKGLLQHFS